MKIAVTRHVSSRFNECELTHLAREPIDVDLARRQHHIYEQALVSLGCQLVRLAEQTDLPDSVFVEDAAVVLPELAVIARPGADSRKPETESIAHALHPYRNLLFIEPPATVDGGDVLVVGKRIFVGLSTRSNPAAVEQLQKLLAEAGYSVEGLEVQDCLHLKSAVTVLAPKMLLINPAWVDAARFKGFELIEIDPAEPYAANALPIGGSVIFPSFFPATRGRMEAAGIKILPVDISELAKAEGAVTCCSLIFDF
jgi:dimethylargininase